MNLPHNQHVKDYKAIRWLREVGIRHARQGIKVSIVETLEKHLGFKLAFASNEQLSNALYKARKNNSWM